MIYLDIETLPTDNPAVIEKMKAGIKAPSNYKDPEKIKAYIENNSGEAVHKTGLSGLFGKVLCIGYAIDDDPVQVIYVDGESTTEESALDAFRKIACKVNSPTIKNQAYCTNTLVGHNALGFDVPFLSQRMMVNGIPPLFRHGMKPWDMSVDDTMLMFAAGSKNMPSLDNLCLAFGIESPKSGLDGSQIHQAWLDGRHEDIHQYCKRDVQTTRSIHKVMTGKESQVIRTAA